MRFFLQLTNEDTKSMPKIEEPLSNDDIWQRRQPKSGDFSVLSNDSLDFSQAAGNWTTGLKNQNLFRSDSNSSLESYASAVSSLNDR